mgnify:CR=1 FL=1|jgi:hypothetical protein
MTITPTVLIAANGILNDSAFAVNADFATEVFDLQDYVVSNVAGTANTSILNAILVLKENWDTSVGTDVTDRDAIWALIKDYKFLRGNRTTATEALTADSIRVTDPKWVCDKYNDIHVLFNASGNKTYKVNYLLQQFEPVVSSSEKIHLSLAKFKNAVWDDISLDIKSHDEIANNGLIRVLLTGSDDQIDNIQALKDNLRTAERLDDVAGRRLAYLSESLRNLGTLFDANDLSNMGKAKTLIENLYSQGLSQLGGLNSKLLELEIDTLDDIKERYLLDILKEVTGKALEEIIVRTKVTLPDTARVTSLADLLDPNNLFTTEALANLPSNTLAGLASVLNNISGKFETLAQVADMLDSIEIPVLSNLTVESQPLPVTDYNAILAQTPRGTGLFNNALITDFINPLTGTNLYTAVKVFNKFNEAVETLLGSATIYSLSAVNQASQTTDTWRNNWVSALTSIMSSSSCVYWLRRCEDEYVDFYNQTETTDKLFQSFFSTSESLMSAWAGWTNVAGKSDDSYASSSRLVSGLHQFGVDSSNLGYNDMFLGLARDNRFGDAIKSALAEGRMVVTESRKGNKLSGSFNEIEYRQELAKTKLTTATSKRKLARIELDKMIEDIAKGVNVDADLQVILRLRVEQTVSQERSLAKLVGVKVNPYLK